MGHLVDVLQFKKQEPVVLSTLLEPGLVFYLEHLIMQAVQLILRPHVRLVPSAIVILPAHQHTEPIMVHVPLDLLVRVITLAIMDLGRLQVRIHVWHLVLVQLWPIVIYLDLLMERVSVHVLLDMLELVALLVIMVFGILGQTHV